MHDQLGPLRVELHQLRERLAAVEQELEQFRRVRPPQLVLPPGRKLAALTSNLSSGGTATCALITYRDGEPVYTDETKTVTDWWMNVADDDWLTGTKIIIEEFGDTWIVVEAWCAPSDTLPEE